MPDGKQIVFAASENGHSSRCYIQNLEGGAPRAVTPEGTTLFMGQKVVSPDGRTAAVIGPDGRAALSPLAGGAPLTIPGIQPGEQRSCARRFAEEACGASLACPPLWTTRSQADGEKLRLGYLSADFREHPVSQLVVETIELHDRNRFEVFGYSYGVDDRSSIRRRLQGAFDTFRDAARMSDLLAFQIGWSSDLFAIVKVKAWFGIAFGSEVRVLGQCGKEFTADEALLNRASLRLVKIPAPGQVATPALKVTFSGPFGFL